MGKGMGGKGMGTDMRLNSPAPPFPCPSIPLPLHSPALHSPALHSLSIPLPLHSLAPPFLCPHSFPEIVLARFAGSGFKSPLVLLTDFTIAATSAVRYDDHRLDGRWSPTHWPAVDEPRDGGRTIRWTRPADTIMGCGGP